MSKLLSEEHIREVFEIQFKDADLDFSYSERGSYYFNDVTHEIFEGFKAAFTLLIPIIERQETALMEINDLLMDGKSMYIADRAKIAYKAIKETNRMLEKLREKSVDD